MNSAVPYFLNLTNSVANTNCAAFLDFSVSGAAVNNYSGYANLSGTILPSTSGFWSNSGSGTFGANYVAIYPTGAQIDFTNSTYILLYEKTTPSGGVLLSTIGQSSGALGSYYQGFEFGVTANNRLYFEYYSQNGPQVYCAENQMADKSSVFLNVNNGNITFGNYDFYSAQLNSYNYPVNANLFFSPTGLYLGYNPNSSGTYTYGKSFYGYISQFLAFSPSIYPFDIVSVNSGFANTYSASTPYVNYINITGITGYTTGVTGYYSAVTGHTVSGTGVVTNAFGIQYTGYSIVDLSGTFYGTGIVPLTGVTSSGITGYSGESVSLSYPFLASVGKSEINILHPVDTNDIVDISLSIDGGYNYSYSKNLAAKADSVKGTFFNSYLRNNGFPYFVFVNGLMQDSGAYVLSGNAYSSSALPVNDYITDTDGEIVFQNTFSTSLDNILLDSSSGSYNSGYYIENFGPQVTGLYTLNWPQNYNIFFNGQKLASGVDSLIGSAAQYGLTGSGIYFKSGMSLFADSGILFGIPQDFSYNITGSFTTNFFPRYADGYSQVYLNGIRMELGDTYLELAKYDLASGSGIFTVLPSNIYNSTTDGF